MHSKLKSIYTDWIFGPISWSKNENYFSFIGETALEEKKTEGLDNLEYLDKYLYKQDFGEELDGKVDPTLFIFGVKEGELNKVRIKEEIYPAAPQFTDTEGELILTGFKKETLKTGLTFCLNRPTALYFIQLANPTGKKEKEKEKNEEEKKAGEEKTDEIVSKEEAKDKGDENSKNKTQKDETCEYKIKQITAEYVSFFPRFNKDYTKVAYIAVEKEFKGHITCLELRSISWPLQITPEFTPTTPKVHIPQIIDEPIIGSFRGIWGSRAFFTDNVAGFITNTLYAFHSIQEGYVRTFIVDMEDKDVNIMDIRIPITDPTVPITPYSLIILTVKDNYLVVKESSMLTAPRVYLVGPVRVMKDLENSNIWRSLPMSYIERDTETVDDYPLYSIEYYNNYLQKIMSGCKLEEIRTETCYGKLFTPPECSKLWRDKKESGDTKAEELPTTPLVIYFHGGPHGSFINSFNPDLLMYLSLGYSLLGVDYRGSAGYTLQFAHSLLGHIGDFDVSDSGEIITKVVNEYPIDKQNVFLEGYSHGGFLSAWLIFHLKYKPLFNSASIRNPVFSCTHMLEASDIPEWTMAECVNSLFTGDLSHLLPTPVTKEIRDSMFFASPISVAHLGTKVATLVSVGMKDRRAPPSQSIHLYHLLKAQGVDTKLLKYDNESHSLTSPDARFSDVLNTILWYEQHMVV